MEQIKFKYNDGGRAKYFTATKVGDCVTRAIAIAAQKDYKEVYDTISKLVGYSPRNGIYSKDTKRILKAFGGKWTATMGIGTGCTTHLRSNELPMGRIVCNCSGHLTAVIDGVLNDTHDCSRNGNRCVYGYWEF